MIIKIVKTISLSFLLVWLSVGQPVGATIYISNGVEYRSGLQLDFDGVDERLTDTTTTYQSDTKTNGRTICLWFNVDSVPASGTAKILFTWSNSDVQGVWNFRLRTDGSGWTGTRWELQTAPDTGAATGLSTFVYSSAQTFSAGTDYHLCLVSTGTAWQLYVDGSSTTVTVASAGVGGNDGDWWGNVNGSGTISFSFFGNASSLTDGRADDLSYFDDDLTASEIALLYNSGKPIHPRAVGLTDLSGYWRMGEDGSGSVSTIHDVVGGDHFTATNMEDADIIPTNYY